MIGVASVEATPALVIVIRHAEKTEIKSDTHLSTRGRDRAKALVGFFTTNTVITANPPIAALFAARPTKSARSVRCGETLEPLRRKLNLPVSETYRGEDFKALAKRLLEKSEYDGKTVVVCWPHDDLPQLAEALGAAPKPKSWKSEVYDRAWLIHFSPAGDVVACKTVQQNLLPGDSPVVGK